MEGNIINTAAVKLAGEKGDRVAERYGGCMYAVGRSQRTLTFIPGHEMAYLALGHIGIFRSSLARALKKLLRLDELGGDAVADALVMNQHVSMRAMALLTVEPR